MTTEEKVRITVLTDNFAFLPGLLAEHGLSCLVESRGRSVLFDTGATNVVCQNAKVMQVDLAGVAGIVLSHGHYDHTGGLQGVLSRVEDPRIFAHPALFSTRYAIIDGEEPRSIGIPIDELQLIAQGGELQLAREPTDVLPGMLVTGQIPRKTSYEDAGGPFFLSPEGNMPDPIEDDQALVVDTSDGLVVVLGCAHSGVVNTLHYATELFPKKRVRGLVGGMHLHAASAERLGETIRELRQFQIDRIAAGHCTGFGASCQLAREFGDRFVPMGAGLVLEF